MVHNFNSSIQSKDLMSSSVLLRLRIGTADRLGKKADGDINQKFLARVVNRDIQPPTANLAAYV